MPGITLAFGAILIGVGLIGFVATGQEHFTALIPAFAGILFVILGLVANKPAARKHAMHAAAALALLGFFGTVGGLIKLFRHLAGTPAARPAAVWAQGIMAVLCIVFVVLCIRSFTAARRARLTGSAM